MIIRAKDTFKLLGIVILCFCAVVVCTLFLNFNVDIAKIKDQITDENIMKLYDLSVSAGKMTSAITGGALGATTVVMLLFYVKNYIDTHRAELGILKALGYSRGRIASSFWVFGLSVFTGTGLGFCGSFLLMPSFYDDKISEVLPDVPIHFNMSIFACIVLLPTAVFSALAVLYAYIKMKRPPLELIRGNRKVKIRKTKQKITDLPFLRELRKNTVWSKISLAFFIWFSALCYASCIIMSFSIQQISDTKMMAYMMAGIGVVLTITTLILSVSTVVKGNAKTIAMLRVFGYSDRECADAILNGYRPLGLIGFVIGTAYQHGLMKLMMSAFFNDESVGIPEYKLNIKTCILAFISFVVLYEIFMKIYSSGIKRISLKEVMGEE